MPLSRLQAISTTPSLINNTALRTILWLFKPCSNASDQSAACHACGVQFEQLEGAVLAQLEDNCNTRPDKSTCRSCHACIALKVVAPPDSTGVPRVHQIQYCNIQVLQWCSDLKACDSSCSVSIEGTLLEREAFSGGVPHTIAPLRRVGPPVLEFCRLTLTILLRHTDLPGITVLLPF